MSCSQQCDEAISYRVLDSVLKSLFTLWCGPNLLRDRHRWEEEIAKHKAGGCVAGERQCNPGQTGTSFRSVWRKWLQCALETHQLGCQWSFSEGSVHGVSCTAPPWGCWPQKQPALGRVIQLAVQQSQLLEQRFPQRTALAVEVYLILLALDKH